MKFFSSTKPVLSPPKILTFLPVYKRWRL